MTQATNAIPDSCGKELDKPTAGNKYYLVKKTDFQNKCLAEMKKQSKAAAVAEAAPYIPTPATASIAGVAGLGTGIFALPYLKLLLKKFG